VGWHGSGRRGAPRPAAPAGRTAPPAPTQEETARIFFLLTRPGEGGSGRGPGQAGFSRPPGGRAAPPEPGRDEAGTGWTRRGHRGPTPSRAGRSPRRSAARRCHSRLPCGRLARRFGYASGTAAACPGTLSAFFGHAFGVVRAVSRHALGVVRARFRRSLGVVRAPFWRCPGTLRALPGRHPGTLSALSGRWTGDLSGNGRPRGTSDTSPPFSVCPRSF